MQEHWRNPSIAARHSKQCLWMPVDACGCLCLCACVCVCVCPWVLRSYSTDSTSSRPTDDEGNDEASTPTRPTLPHCAVLRCAALHSTAGGIASLSTISSATTTTAERATAQVRPELPLHRFGKRSGDADG